MESFNSIEILFILMIFNISLKFFTHKNKIRHNFVQVKVMNETDRITLSTHLYQIRVIGTFQGYKSNRFTKLMKKKKHLSVHDHFNCDPNLTFLPDT